MGIILLVLNVAERREFSGMIHWLTINNHPSNPQQPIQPPYVKRTSKMAKNMGKTSKQMGEFRLTTISQWPGSFHHRINGSALSAPRGLAGQSRVGRVVYVLRFPTLYRYHLLLLLLQVSLFAAIQTSGINNLLHTVR